MRSHAAMCGAEAVVARASAAYASGDYRWAAELNDHAVMADPSNEKACALQADILEQLGYQAESGVWRNEYLVAAKELREGVKPPRSTVQGPGVVSAMTPEMVFDLVAVRLDHQKVDVLAARVQVNFSASRETYALELSNAVLNNTRGRSLSSPDATLTLTHAAFFKMILARTPVRDLTQAGEARLDGDPKALDAIFTNLTTFSPTFEIVTPTGTARPSTTTSK